MLHLKFDVRNKDGVIYKDQNGNPQPTLKTTLDVGVKAKQAIKRECEDICKFLEAISGSTRITVSVMVKNNISSTYMSMYSYYWGEKAFVEHK